MMAHQDPAPPRRKSCEACKTAKRRCDLAFPACSRCISRNLPCSYPGRLPAAYQDLVDESPPTIPTNAMDHMWLTTAMTHPSPIHNGLCAESILDSAPEPREPQLDWNQYVSDELSTTSFFEGPLSPTNFAVALPRARSLRPLSVIVASHLQFTIDVLKTAPQMMVIENRTPWCHQQLYKSHNMPQVMQDAYACCSLYMCKNDINAPVIMNLFDARTRELLSAPEPTETLDILARTQALILYQIMRLFDGDIRSHATADALFTTLESSVLTLMAIVPTPKPYDPTELLPLSMEDAATFWEGWVLQESARRTVLFTYYFIQIFKVLQGRVPVSCDGKLGLEHSWYLSGDLWNASSAFDFAVAWTEKQHHIVYNLDFEPVLQNAQPGEVDLFGRMLLVTALGIDKAKAWFHIRGAIL